jgi:membrane protease YdiL (CAAX protease family)
MWKIDMKSNRLSAREWVERLSLALLFIAFGSTIIIVFSPLRPLLDGGADYLGRIGLILFLLVALSLVRKSTPFEKYWQVFLGLLILAIAVSLDWVFQSYLMDSLGVMGKTPLSFALLKLNECAVVVCSVILLTRMGGGNLGSIYIQKGNLKQGLIIGGIAFFVCVAGSIPMTFLMFKPGDLTFARIISWIPWILISVLANATQEELLFRGLFLRKLQPFYGKFFSILLIVFVFTLLHKGITYTANDFLFLAALLPLGWAWGYVMQKTDGVWGSILFHAGTDIPIFLSIFSNLK